MIPNVGGPAKEQREITKIIFHCSDTDRPGITISDVRDWHLARGFRDVGYHFFVRTDGVIETGRGIESVGAHCEGHNLDSVGICLNGRKHFERRQFEAAYTILDLLIRRCPNARIFGHRDFDKGGKTCPNYDLEELKGYWEGLRLRSARSPS